MSEQSLTDGPAWPTPILCGPRYPQALVRGLAVLTCFAPEQQSHGRVEVAERIADNPYHYPPPSNHRAIWATLERDAGYCHGKIREQKDQRNHSINRIIFRAKNY